MPEVINEEVPAHEQAAARAGSIAVEFAMMKDNLAESRDSLSNKKVTRIRKLSYELSKLVSENLADGMNKHMLSALRYMSLGYRDREAAELEEVEEDTMKIRKAEAKKKLGASTKPQAVVEGINKGYVPIELDLDGFEHLTPAEERTLYHFARGRTGREIADICKISLDSVGTHRQNLRERLGAKNINHAMRRAFEVGIFKVGEPIDDPEALAPVVGLNIEGLDIDLNEARINKPSELELFKALMAVGPGMFSFRDIADSNFYEALSERGRRNVFGTTLRDLSKKLEIAAGERVIESKKIRIGGGQRGVYVFRKEVVISVDGEVHTIPAYDKPLISPNHYSLRSPAAPKIRKKRAGPKKAKKKPKPIPGQKPLVQAKTESVSPEPVPEPEPEIQIEEVEFVHEPKDLPPLDEDLLGSLKNRDRDELNMAIKVAAAKISRKTDIDYRTKIVLALRYGVPPSSSNLGIINRAGEYIRVSDIQDYISSHQGLDLESAYLVSGLTPLKLLEAELKLIDGFKASFPALEELKPKIEMEIRRLSTAQ